MTARGSSTSAHRPRSTGPDSQDPTNGGIQMDEATVLTTMISPFPPETCYWPVPGHMPSPTESRWRGIVGYIKSLQQETGSSLSTCSRKSGTASGSLLCSSPVILPPGHAPAPLEAPRQPSGGGPRSVFLCAAPPSAWRALLAAATAQQALGRGRP